MARPGITLEQVAAAAESILAAGARPTIDSIRAALGTGSPNTVLRHLNTWRAARPAVQVAAVELPASLLAGISNEIARAAAAARSESQSDLAEARGERDELAQAGEALEAVGFATVINVSEGFEGPLDEHHHRGTLGGWRFHGLPWQQN